MSQLTFNLSSPSITRVMAANLTASSSLVSGSGGKISYAPTAQPGVGIGAGNIDGAAYGNVVVGNGSGGIVSVDCTNLGASLTLFGNAANAAAIVALGIWVSSIGPADSPAETCVVGGGANAILAANSAVLANNEDYGFQKNTTGGLNISSGAKIITLNGSAGTMVLTICAYTRSA
jgi:hypothetical protein